MIKLASWKSLLALTPLAAASVLGAPQPAQAFLVYYIYEDLGDVVVKTNGSLTLGIPDTLSGNCTDIGALSSSLALICTGNNAVSGDDNFGYKLTGPTSFNGTVNVFIGDTATGSVQGIRAALDGAIEKRFLIDKSYSSGSPIDSSARFDSTTLADLGFTATGLIGTWTLTGSGDTINVCVDVPFGSPCGAPPAPAVPGPLPLLGAGAAFGFSRRLRRRVNQSRVAANHAESISA